MCSKGSNSLNIGIGPLTYHLKAENIWGHSILAEIRDHLSVHDLTGPHDRKIFLTTEDHENTSIVKVYSAFFSSDPADLKRRENNIDTVWKAVRSTTAVWTNTTCPSIGPVRFSLPWSLIIDDIVARGGGLIHAGLACYKSKGVLFIAPPNGGKSTTLSTAPADWEVFSDDAALVWPEENSWFASPLPAWGDLTRPHEAWPWPGMKLDSTCEISCILSLRKHDHISLNKLKPADALPNIYQALSEYPVSVMCGVDHSEEYFRSAAQIARALSVYNLSLPRHADIWSLLIEEAL